MSIWSEELEVSSCAYSMNAPVNSMENMMARRVFMFLGLFMVIYLQR